MTEQYKKAWNCKRCGHLWVNRKRDKPLVCPRCHSYLWDRERPLPAKGDSNES